MGRARSRNGRRRAPAGWRRLDRADLAELYWSARQNRGQHDSAGEQKHREKLNGPRDVAQIEPTPSPPQRERSRGPSAPCAMRFIAARARDRVARLNRPNYKDILR